MAGPHGGDEFVKTTFIQRLNTSGGVGPVGGYIASETPVKDVPYTADYHFWKAASKPALRS